MLLKCLYFLCLLNLLAAAEIGDQKNTSNTDVTTSVPSSIQSCTTGKGDAGECVPYYLCNVTIEREVIDIAGGVGQDTQCESYQVCCPQSSGLQPTASPQIFDFQREGCGWSSPLVLSRELEGESKFAEFPWMCAVLKIEPANNKEDKNENLNTYVGGGSLIHPSVVLTAAHVASTPLLLVRAGEWDTQSTMEPHPHQTREVASLAVHQDYMDMTLFYDIALLFLSKPMDLAPNVGVACLPPPRERVPGGTKCFATGWGKDKFGKEGRYQVILKKVELPVVEHSTCQQKLRNTRLRQAFTLHTSFMCAGGELGKDVCTGDGGSPLSCPIEFEKERFMQSGIVAWSIGCSEEDVPGVYVDVSNLRSWIDDKVAGKGYDPKTYSY